MPSPFPGMDPYLENPTLWPDVHHRLISVIGEVLTAKLRPAYFARLEQRLYVTDETDPGRAATIIPDVHIVATLEQTWAENSWKGDDDGGGVAVVEPIMAKTLLVEEVCEMRVEIIDAHSRSVVAVIEVLSPANKVPAAAGRKSYADKRREVMQSPSHFVEIDLLRAGDPMPTEETLPDCDYRVHVSRIEDRPDGKLWMFNLRDRLPDVPIPLKKGDPDVVLSLRSVLATAYERAGYDLDIDYRRDPVPPFQGKDATWANRLLVEQGLRPKPVAE